MFWRAVRLIAINLVVLCVLAEAAGLWLFYEETGRLFYTYRHSYEPIGETRQGRLTGEGLHPYFGPTHRSGNRFDIPDSMLESPSVARLTTNNFGFVAVQDYPYVPAGPRQYVIGIFGGSVGVWFCQVGVHAMLRRLEQHPFFKDRELVPVCFSHEGYKQPQQLIVLSYFMSIGQQFDMVINIDGFNEVALGSMNHQRGLDISMPSVMHIDPLVNLLDQATLTPAKLQSLSRIEADKERLNSVIARMDGAWSAAVGFVLRRMYNATLASYRQELDLFARLPSNPSASSLLLTTPRLRGRDDARLYDDIARSWAESSVLMNELLTSRGVPYFHVLQPNQYFTTRTFSPDEARIARSDASPFRTGAERGYPVLLQASKAGALGQVNFSSAVEIFDREPSAAYVDDCCHYTLRGNQLLGEFIAMRILASKGPWN